MSVGEAISGSAAVRMNQGPRWSLRSAQLAPPSTESAKPSKHKTVVWSNGYHFEELDGDEARLILHIIMNPSRPGDTPKKDRLALGITRYRFPAAHIFSCQWLDLT